MPINNALNRHSVGFNLGNSNFDESGIFNSTVQPCFSALLSSTFTNFTGGGTAQTVVFDTVLFNVGSLYNSSTGVFTPTDEGLYLFTYCLSFNSITAPVIGGISWIDTPAGLQAQNSFNPFAQAGAASSQISVQGTALYLNTLGQDYRVKVEMDGDVADNVTLLGVGSFLTTYFQAYKLA